MCSLQETVLMTALLFYDFKIISNDIHGQIYNEYSCVLWAPKFPWIRIILIIITIGFIPHVVCKCLSMVITIITKHKLKRRNKTQSQIQLRNLNQITIFLRGEAHLEITLLNQLS
jgi:hypothetical protein